MRFNASVCRKFGVLGLVAGVLGWGADARATVTEPNRVVVPGASSTAGEIPLSTLFADRNEAIDWKVDAHAEPDTFSPLCDFTASFVMKQSGSSLGVGWYNVDPTGSRVPPLAEIYTIFASGTAVGTTVSGASIRADTRYKGGLIGFALTRSPPNYSERKLNTICNAGTCASTPGNWILSLAYKSTVVPNAYYIAFEDGDVSSTGWSNDGDFNDYVFLFQGLACPGAGVACTVPNTAGACAHGLTECDATGALTCKQVTPSASEKCDGVDNDCNGTVDEGDLCTAGKVCSRGVCVPRCGSGEFGCKGTDVCVEGVCVEPSCADVACPDDQVCTGGKCKGACDGVVCPGTQVCRVGRCVDPCAGVSCAAGRVCEGGVCVNSCACQACGASLSCNATSGHCVDSACANATCAADAVCVKGACQSSCKGVVCPTAQSCIAGQCIDDPAPPPPVENPEAGTFDPGPMPSDSDASAANPTAPDAGATPAAGSFDTKTAACGCRVTGSAADVSPLAFGLVALVSATVRRARRSRTDRKR